MTDDFNDFKMCVILCLMLLSVYVYCCLHKILLFKNYKVK